MSVAESRRHHFVPKFLLRPWLRAEGGQFHLKGYSWDEHTLRLKSKDRGLDAFCWQLGLLSLRAHRLGRDALERRFFGEIDDKGAVARDLLVVRGQVALSRDQRVEFARLLLSLETRRPTVAATIRDHEQPIREGLDSDPEVLQAAAEAGLTEKPSEYFERWTGVTLHDRLFAGMIQKLTDNAQVGGVLVAAHWTVKRLDPRDGTLVLGDRPLVRFYGYDRPGGTWIWPLTPHAAFVAVNDAANLNRIERSSSGKFLRWLNTHSARQAERFVFSVDDRDERWLPKHLNRTGPPNRSRRAASGPRSDMVE